MATSETSGTSYQTKHTYLFVPKAFGANTDSASDDTNEPGAYFRLGNYSNDIEGALSTADAQKKFYPRQHVTDQSGEGTVVKDAAGDNTTYETVTDPDTGATETINTNTNNYSGIMLACSGRLLVHAGEKAYIHSVGDMHVDTQGDMKINTDKSLTVTATDKIDITSGASKNIKIDAGGGTGDVDIKAKEATKSVNGKDYEYITDNVYKYYQCSLYTYKLGGIVNVTVAGQFHYSFGFTLKINTDIVIAITIATKFTFYGIKIDIGIWKVDFVAFKTELKDGEVKTSKLYVKAKAVSAETAAVSAKTDSVEAETTGVRARSNAICSDSIGVEASNGALDVSVKGITVVT